MLWHGAGAPVTIQSQIYTPEVCTQVQGKILRDQEATMASELNSILSESTLEVGQGNKGLSLYDSQKGCKELFHYEPESFNQLNICTQFKITSTKQVP